MSASGGQDCQPGGAAGGLGDRERSAGGSGCATVRRGLAFIVDMVNPMIKRLYGAQIGPVVQVIGQAGLRRERGAGGLGWES